MSRVTQRQTVWGGGADRRGFAPSPPHHLGLDSGQSPLVLGHVQGLRGALSGGRVGRAPWVTVRSAVSMAEGAPQCGRVLGRGCRGGRGAHVPPGGAWVILVAPGAGPAWDPPPGPWGPVAAGRSQAAPPGRGHSPLPPPEEVLESYENPPPIVLPSEGFQVDLDAECPDERVSQHLLYLRHFLCGLRSQPGPSGAPARPEGLQVPGTPPRGARGSGRPLLPLSHPPLGLSSLSSP